MNIHTNYSSETIIKFNFLRLSLYFLIGSMGFLLMLILIGFPLNNLFFLIAVGLYALLFSIIATLFLTYTSSIKISEKGLDGRFMIIKQIDVKWNDIKKISYYYNLLPIYIVWGKSSTDFLPIPNPYMTKNIRKYKDLLTKYTKN